MDPTATLGVIDEILTCNECAGMYTGGESELNQAMNDLTTWLGKGGFEPDWSAYPKATVYFQS